MTVSLLSQVLLATFSDTEPLWPQLDAAVFAAQKLESVNLAIHDIALAYLLALRLPESYSTLRNRFERFWLYRDQRQVGRRPNHR